MRDAFFLFWLLQLPVDALHQPVHGFRHLGIQPRNRLVQYQHFIRSTQGPGQQYPLLLLKPVILLLTMPKEAEAGLLLTQLPYEVPI